MGYSTPYIILNIVLLILSVLSFLFKRESAHKQLAVLSMIVFVVFFCFRGYVQTDTINYYSLFERLPNIFKGILYEPNYDKGFLVYMGVIKSFGFNYNHFIAISSFIDLILLTILFRQYFSYQYYPFFIFLFLVFSGLDYGFNLMRNIKAVLLFLISVKYIYSRNIGKFLILNLIGLSFHWSSIIFFPLYFFLHKKMSLRTLCILFFVGISVYISMPYLLNPVLRFIANIFHGNKLSERINIYLEINRYAVSKAFGLMDIVTITWYALILITYNKIKKVSSDTICFINLFVVYFIFCCMSSGMILFRQRVAVLFEPTCWLLFIWLLKSQNYRNKIFIFSIIVIYGTLLTFRRTKNDILFKYDNIILSEKILTIEERLETFDKVKSGIDWNK